MKVVARLQSRNVPMAAADWTPAQRDDLGAAAPARLAQPEDEAALRELAIEAGVAESALLILGGGTALGLGQPLTRGDLAVSTRGLARVVEYSPADFVVTVEAGARLADLQRELAANRQWLAIEPSDPDRATIGGLIASAATSLVASGHGTLRHHLLGLRVLYADGRFAKAGGRVVKNVAGYDLMKMHHGALGTLGIVVAATLRLRPLPAADLVAWVELEEPGAQNASERIDAIVAVAEALAQPGFAPSGVHFVGPLGADRPTGIGGDLVVRFQGARAAVLEQTTALTTHAAAARLGTWRRELIDTPSAPAALGSPAPRARPLLAIEQACSRGDLAGTLHLSLHFPPSRLRELLATLARFGAGQVALELARGTGFLKLATDGGTSPLIGSLAHGVKKLKQEIEAQGGALCLHAGPAAIRAIVPPYFGHGFGQGFGPGASDGAARLVAGLKQELDPRGLLHRGRLGERA